MDLENKSGSLPTIKTVERILDYVDGEPANRNQIHEDLGIDWNSVNNGLAWMKEKGLVKTVTKEGKDWKLYKKNEDIEVAEQKLKEEDELPEVDDIL